MSCKKNALFLVTGGAGFIGSNLCEGLLKEGQRVLCLDNFSTGSEENLKTFRGNPNFSFVFGDIRDEKTCFSLCEGVDFVLHEAAWGSVPRSVEMPVLYGDINIRGTLNMLEAARRSKVKCFVYASSSSVYGDSPTLPKREGTEGALLSPYALTKRAAEEYAKLYTRLYGLKTVGLRYFNVYGKRQDPHGPYAAVIPRFIGQLLRGETPTIYGDGKQSRDFTCVADVVQANLKAVCAGAEAAGEVFNIAFGGRQCLSAVYDAIAAALGSGVKPRYAPERKGDIRHSCADIGKAKRVLGYEPQYDFARGLGEAIGWYRENLA